MFLDIEKKNVENVKKGTYGFTGHLITQPLITQLPEVTNIKHLAQKCGHAQIGN